jgi:pimeloyl-ACP methyl ester carboxylesterase
VLKRLSLIALFLSLAAVSAGCGYFGYYTSQAHWHKTFDTFPSVAALNKIDPKDSLVLSGSIIRKQTVREPLLIVAVSNRYEKNEKVVLVQVPASSDSYTAFLPRGEYSLFVFADLDHDGTFQKEECVGSAPAIVEPEYSKGGMVVDGPTVIADDAKPRETDFRVREEVRPTSYIYTSLDDEFFDPRFGSTGLYHPSELIAHTQGFLFSLGHYDEGKTVVLFVHGISGTPRDWKFIVSGMDKSRFQPFFFFYPSGLSLGKLGALLEQTLAALIKTANSDGNKVVLVAHSMGGLVALSAIQQLEEENIALVDLYCSFSTPYRGDETAKKWVGTAPLVVPVWNDIAAGSEFLKGLEAKPFPKGLPFYLFFSYHDTSPIKIGESGDGMVTLRSQLDPVMQAAAGRVYGFNETHDGILNSEAVRAQFLHLLNAVSPPR